MYLNLKAEMARKDMKIDDLAKALGISAASASKRLSGKAKLSLKDAKEIKNALGVDIPLEELFKEE